MIKRWLIGFSLYVVLASSGLAAAVSPVWQDSIIDLVYGQTVEGRIDSDQPSLFYAFNAAEGDVVTLAMVATEGDLDPFLVLNDDLQSPLATDDNSGGDLNAQLTLVIPTEGRYIIQATNAGGIPPETGGTFSLSLAASVNGVPVENLAEPTAEPTASPAPTPVPTATLPALPEGVTAAQGDNTRLVALESGLPVRDTLDRQVAVRYYWFEAQSGDQIAITPEQLADFKPLMVLYNSSFVEQQRVAPGIGMQMVIREPDVFFLGVSLPDTGSAGGSYGFVFEQSENLAGKGAFTSIAYGETARGTIDETTPAITYEFQGTAGDTVTIAMSRTGGDLNSYLYLLDESGQLLFEDNDSGADNGDARIVFSLPADGIYLIVATRLGQAQGGSSGSFLLELTSDADPPPAAATETSPLLPPEYETFPQIVDGETVEGQLSDERYRDVYVFYGERGNAITVEMISQNLDEFNGLDPLLILLDADRIPLLEVDDIVPEVERNARLEYTLPETGYYAIVATRFEQEAGTSAGPYTLTLTSPAQPDTSGDLAQETSSILSRLPATPLSAGVPVQETFDVGADLYSFSSTAGALIDLSVTTDPGLDAILILADKHLTEVLSSGAGILTGVTTPNTGQYLVLVAPRFGPVDGSGGYILALSQTADELPELEIVEGTQPLEYGDVVRGEINDEQVSRFYTFAGEAGDRVQIVMEAAPDSALDCYLELRDENDELVDANDDIEPGVIRDAQLTIDLPADGTYTLVASRYVGPDTELTEGEYILSLELLAENVVDGVSPSTVPLAYGQTLTGEINDEQYLLFYVFDGEAGDVVTIEVTPLSGNLDAVLHLYQSVGNQWLEIANNDDAPSGGTFAPLLDSIILPSTGKYLIAVNRYGLDLENTFGTFAITLTLES